MEIFTTDARKAYLKKNISEKTHGFVGIASELDCEARIRMENPTYSVTFSESRAKIHNKHDYYSEAPYWWPNPENPDGPFIRRDGFIYPKRLCRHTDDMAKMADDVYILSVAGYIFDNEKYSDKAEKLIRVWFLDEETKMNPHLDYAQAITGVSTGRGIGIIDTVRLIDVIRAMDFLSMNDKYSDTVARLQGWFSDYVTWLDTSKNGKDERDYFNNHANWWNTQTAIFSVFCGNSEMEKFCFDRFGSFIMEKQTGNDGEFLDELTRTRSLTYCFYNLDASCVLAELAHSRGIDLWNREFADGKGIKKSLEYMYPYYVNPYLWKHEQVEGVSIPVHLAFTLGQVRTGMDFSEGNRLRQSGRKYFSDLGYSGALCLSEGFIF